jgi:hypothetical protein
MQASQGAIAGAWPHALDPIKKSAPLHVFLFIGNRLHLPAQRTTRREERCQ